jgi:hypothetical protein
MRHSTSFLLLAAAGLIAAGGCGDDSTGPAGPGTLVIQFDNTVDGQPLQLNNQIYTNAAGNTYGVTRLEYVTSHFHLHPVDHDDPEFESDDPHYRTEADASTRTLTFTGVPAGSYHELSLVMGIPGADNVSGAYPELDLASMGWPDSPPMQLGGYHYMRLEGTWDAGTMGFATHTGPTMGMDFSFEVSMDTDIVVSSGGTTTVTLQMDINEWYANPNLYDFMDHDGPIMGSAPTQALLQQNGADVFTILSVTTE